MILFISPNLSSWELGDFEGRRGIPEPWAFMAGDSPAYAQNNFPDQDWSKWRSTQGVSLPGDEGFFWLRLKVTLSSELQYKPLYFVFGKLDAPAEFYLNGILLAKRGQFPPDYKVIGGLSFLSRLPSTLIRWDDENVLAVRVYFAGPRTAMPEPFFADEGAYRFETQISDLLNNTVYFFCAAINFFAGLFFLIQFFYRKKYKANLFFALSSLFMGVYFFEMGALPLGIPADFVRHLAKGSLSLSMGFLILFFIEYFQIHNRNKLKIIIMGVFIIFGAYVFLSPNETALADRFRLALLPVQVGIVAVAYMVVRAIFKGNRDAIPIMVGTIVGVGCGTYDTVYFAMGLIPFAWLQGVGFFSVEVSMFVSLAVRSSRLYTELEKSSEELEAKRTELIQTNLAMSRFVPQEFLSFLGRDSITQIRLGDKVLKEMTVLFSDIRSFTSLSENLSPDDNFRLLNSYLSKMAPVIRESGGIIDKYIGDAIMALFPGSPSEAILAAVRMRETLKEYNEGRLRAGYSPLEMGIGLHCGTLMMGTIGEDQRMDSTVISDAVNVASRLESLTKVFGVPVLVSSAALEQATAIKGLLVTRYVGTVQVRGKEKGIGVYEVLVQGSDHLFATKLNTRDEFEIAVKLFEAGEIRSAKTAFTNLLNKDLSDPVVDRYLKTLKKGYMSITWEM